MIYIELDKLKLHKDNPRKISHKELEKLAKSISENPEYFEARPIITDKNFVIYAGNSRYKAAKKLGLEKVPVHILDLPEDKMREIMIRDNVNNGDWDMYLLAEDWTTDTLIDFGLEFKKFKAEQNDDEQDGDEPQTKNKNKKVRAKKIITCPHCNKEVEI